MTNAFQLEMITNFRDLGGAVSAEGQQVRAGQIYRSGAPGGASEADRAVLDRLGLRTFCDLRTAGERERLPNPEIAGATQVNLSVSEDSTDTDRVRAAIAEGDMGAIGAQRLVEGNRAMVRKYTTVFAQVLRLVSDPMRRPVVIHCSAGKDRAGLASALILLALGVPETAVMENFLVSNLERAVANAHTQAMVRSLIAERDQIAAEAVDLQPLVEMLTVQPAYLQAAIDTMIEDHGSITGYISEGLGFGSSEVARLRTELLA